jgi:hypothetical protein
MENQTEVPAETFIVFEDDGSSHHTSDLNELDEGAKVAVYQLVRVGTLKQHANTVEPSNG